MSELPSNGDMATTAESARISKYEAYSHEGEAFGLPSLAAQARVVLDINKAERHIRGGLATKEKYEQRLQACSKEDMQADLKK